MNQNPKDIECEDAIRMLLEYLDNELRPHDHEALETHIHKCRSCFTRLEFEKRLKGILKESPRETASTDLRHRIKKITQQF